MIVNLCCTHSSGEELKGKAPPVKMMKIIQSKLQAVGLGQEHGLRMEIEPMREKKCGYGFPIHFHNYPN